MKKLLKTIFVEMWNGYHKIIYTLTITATLMAYMTVIAWAKVPEPPKNLPHAPPRPPIVMPHQPQPPVSPCSQQIMACTTGCINALGKAKQACLNACYNSCK